MLLGFIGLRLNESLFALLGAETPRISFGQAPVFLAFAALGPGPGLLACTLAELRMIVRWDTGLWLSAFHAAEAIGMYVIFTRSRSISFAVAMYWLTVGPVTDLFLFGLLGGSTWGHMVIQLATQLMAGVVNGLIADAFLMAGTSRAAGRLFGLEPTAIAFRDYALQRVVFIVLAPALAMALVQRAASNDMLVQGIESQIKDRVARVAAQIETLTLDREQSLQRLARTAGNLRPDSPTLNAALASFHRDHREFVGVGLTDADGRVVASSPLVNSMGTSLIGFALGDRDYWRETRDRLVPSYGPLVLGTLQVRRSEAEPILPIAIPVTDTTGRFSGAVLASLDAVSLNDQIAGESPWRVTLVDRNDHVIFSDGEASLSGAHVSTRFPGGVPREALVVFRFRVPAGDNFLDHVGLHRNFGATDRVVRTGWRAVVEFPAAALQREMAVQARKTLWVLFSTIGVLYLAVFRLTREMARPVQALSTRVQDLASSHSPGARAATTRPVDKAALSPIVELQDLEAQLTDVETLVAQRGRATANALVAQNNQLLAANGAVAQAEAQLRHLVESVRVTVWRADASTFRFTFVSAEAEALLGYPCDLWLNDPDFWKDHIHPEDRERAISYCVAQTSAGQHHTFEYRMIARDGRVVWLRDIVRVVNREGQPQELVGALIDVSEQRLAEMALRDAEAELRHLVESVRVILFRLDPEHGTPSFVSGEAQAILGYSCQQWLMEPHFWRNHLHPDDRETTMTAVRAGVQGGNDFSFESRMVAADGRVVWLRTLVRNPGVSGEKNHLLGVMIDVTAAKEALETDAELRALLEQAALDWERTFDAIQAPVLLVDRAERLVRANLAAQLLLERREPPLRLSDLAQSEPWTTMRALVRQALTEGSSTEGDAVETAGGTTWAVTVSPRAPETPDREPSVVVIARDVSDERLNASHRAFLTELWSALAHAQNLDEAVKIVLQHLCEFTAWEMGQVYVLNPDRSSLACVEVWHQTVAGFESFHRASREARFRSGEGLVGRVWATGEPVLTNEFPRNALPHRAEAAAAIGLQCMLALPVRSGDEVVAVVELFRRTPRLEPVSMKVKAAAVGQLGALIERYRAQAALAEHERSHSRLLSNLSGMAYRCLSDDAWTMTYASDGCLDLTGHSPEALCLGRPAFADLIHPDDRERRLSGRQKKFAEREPCSCEYRILSGHGVEKWVWDQAQGVYDSEGRLESIEGFVTDISARKQAEVELQTANTMVAMGELVAGVAHEVRNPLFAISANIDAFEARFGVQEPFAEIIATLRGEVERLIALMNDLLDYGRPISEALTPGALEPVVAQAVRLCSGQARLARVEIRDRTNGKLPLLLMDRRRLVQVFQNLIQNSIQHSPPGGEIEIDAVIQSSAQRSTLCCTVADAGTGFHADDLHRLFEPFFSRRRGGTGLGLAIAQRIVHEHGGTIRARNRTGAGAEMEVRLPTLEPE